MPLFTPPTEADAERIVLGSILKNSSRACEKAALDTLMFPGAWACDAHALIMKAVHRHVCEEKETSEVSAQAVADLLAAGEALPVFAPVPGRVQAVADLLAAGGLLGAAGGVAYLESLLPAAREDVDALDAVLLVLEATARRQLTKLAADLQHAAAGSRSSLLPVTIEAHRQIRDVVQHLIAPAMPKLFAKLADSVHLMETLHTRGCMFRTGYTVLDRKLLGLRPGDLCVFAAYPHVDLTAFLVGILHRGVLSSTTGVPALVTTPRDSLLEMLVGLLQSKVPVSLNRVAEGKLTTEAAWSEVLSVVDELYTAPGPGRFSVCRLVSQSVEEVRIAAGMMKQEHGIRLLIVDGPDVVTRAGNPDSMAAVRDLKKLAGEFDIPVIVLARLQNPVLGTPATPSLKALEELGPLVAMADTLALLWLAPCLCEEFKGSDSDDLNIFVARHWRRSGCQLRLHYVPEFRSYEDARCLATGPNAGNLKW